MNELSGYKEVKIVGRMFPMKFGVNASALFCLARGVDLPQIAETGLYGRYEGEKMISPPDVYALLQLAWFAHVTACKIGGRDTEVASMEEFIELCNEEEGTMEEITRAMLESKFLGRKITGEAKKKPN